MSDETRPVGRPTEFKPEYGEQILTKMTAGLSLTAAAAEIDVHRQRVYEWVETHPEFADAVKLAMSKRVAFLEHRLIDLDSGPKITATIFALKNASPEDWRDKRDVEHSGSVGIRHEDALEQLK